MGYGKQTYRKPSVEPVILASPDAFSDYLVRVADNILENMPKLKTDPVANLTNLPSTFLFVRWKEVSAKDIIKGQGIKKPRCAYGVSCVVLKTLLA